MALLDFENAFNSISGEHMLQVRERCCPGLLPYFYVCYTGAGGAHMCVGQFIIGAAMETR